MNVVRPAALAPYSAFHTGCYLAAMSLHTPDPAYGPTGNGKWDAVLLADAMMMLWVTNPARLCIDLAKAPSDRHKQSGAGQKEGAPGGQAGLHDCREDWCASGQPNLAPCSDRGALDVGEVDQGRGVEQCTRGRAMLGSLPL